MFYCNKCADQLGWPKTLFRSKGPCECCHEVAICNEKRASELPPVKSPDSLEDLVDVLKRFK